MCSTKYEPQCQQGSEKKCDTVTETVNEQVEEEKYSLEDIRLTFCSISTEVRDCERAEVLDHKRAAVHNGPGADLHPAAGQHLVKERNPRIWSSFAPIFNLMCRTESARLCTSRSVTA